METAPSDTAALPPDADRRAIHLATLEQTIAELLPVSRMTAAPAPNAYQFVGTMVDNTLTLLLGVTNCLDQGNRSIQFSNFRNWISAMQAVHRSFYSSIIMAVEKSLTEYCLEERIQVKSSRLQDADKLIEELSHTLTDKQAKAIRRLAGRDPQFRDYVDTVLRAKLNDQSRRKTWVKYFDALRVLRNKASHSDVSLSDSERETLMNGECGQFVSAEGTLQTNTTTYKYVLDRIFMFYQDIGIPLPQNEVP